VGAGYLFVIFAVLDVSFAVNLCLNHSFFYICVWYQQLYLPVIEFDAISGQALNMRFTEDVSAVTKAVDAVFGCDVKCIEPLIRQYGSLLNTN